MAHPRQIAALVREVPARARIRSAPASAAGRPGCPKADFGAGRAWVARELQWDAYLLRAASVYEEECGAPHDHPGRLLPVQRAAPTSARAAGCTTCCRWSTPIPRSRARSCATRSRCSREPAGSSPTGCVALCKRFNALGTSNDLDFWLLLAAAEYGLGTRDLRFFDERLPFDDSAPRRPASGSTSRSRSATRSRCAARTAATSRARNGDWSDFSTHVPADDRVDARDRPARLRLPAARRAGRPARRPRLRATAARARRASCAAVVRREWTGRGWYSRGYTGDARSARGVIFGEPQPWAILAGVPSARQAPGRWWPTSAAS